MKTFCTTFVLAVSLLTVTAHAQSGMSVENWKDIKVGPMFTGGLAIHAGSADTILPPKSGFAFSAGGRMQYPFSTNMALDVAVCYDSRSISAETSDGTIKTTSTVSYISLRPGFNIGGFTIGLGLGLPIGFSADLNGSSVPTSTSDLGMLIEGRAGASVSMMEFDNGNQLRLLLEGSYGFTKINKTAPSDEKNNGPLATAEIGLAYYFDTNPH